MYYFVIICIYQHTFVRQYIYIYMDVCVYIYITYYCTLNFLRHVPAVIKLLSEKYNKRDYAWYMSTHYN